MKNSRLLFLLVLIFNLSLFSGCKPKVPKIGILIHSYGNERWPKDKDNLVEDLTRLGAEALM